MKHTTSKHQQIQLWIVAILATTYAILATSVGHAPIAALVGLGATILSGCLGYKLGPRRQVGPEIFLVWGSAFMTVGMVLLSATDQSFTVAASIAVIGIFCTLGSYSIWRLPLPSQDSRGVSLRDSTVRAIGNGLAIAFGICVFATLIVAIGAAVVTDDSAEPVFTRQGYEYLMLAYVAAGVAGGLVVGLLRPLGKWPLGAMVIGIPVATLAYGAVGLAMLFMGDADGPSTLGETAAMSIGIGFAVGPMGGLWFRNGR